jgi:hypothetical protein
MLKKIIQKPFISTILLALALFLTDKIFLIPSIKKIVLYYKKVEIFFYESRFELFEYLKTYRNREYALILGSSRSGMFSYKEFQQEMGKESYIFNFSAPLAGTSYYYYWLEKIDSSLQKKPQWILMELDAINLGNPSVYISLPYSYDPIFMLRYMDFYRDIPQNIPQEKQKKYIDLIFSSDTIFKGFSADEVDTYFMKYFFIINRYSIHPNKIFENFKKIDYFDETKNTLIKIPLYEFAHRTKLKNLENFKHTLGGIPVEFYTQIPEKDLSIDAQRNFLRLLPSSELSSTQLIFLKKILDLTHQQNIPLIIYKPSMTEYANQILKTYHLYDLEDLIKQFERYQNIIYIDTTSISCKKFSDSVHLSPECYKELTKFISTYAKKKVPNQSKTF